MHDQLAQFQWKIHTRGYRWVQLKQHEQSLEGDQDSFSALYLAYNTHLVSAPSPGGYRTYRPFNDSRALFRTFVDLGASPTGILQFANTYGLLCHYEMASAVCLDRDGSVVFACDPFDLWRSEITAMNKAVTSWELLRNEQMSVTGMRNQSIKGRVGAETFESITNAINDRLRTHTRPCLSNDSGDPELCIIPTSLIGGMWLQFARAVSGREHYGRCTVCNDWFVGSLGPSGGRRKLFCSSACRQKAYRQRSGRSR